MAHRGSRLGEKAVDLYKCPVHHDYPDDSKEEVTPLTRRIVATAAAALLLIFSGSAASADATPALDAKRVISWE